MNRDLIIEGLECLVMSLKAENDRLYAEKDEDVNYRLAVMRMVKSLMQGENTNFRELAKEHDVPENCIADFVDYMFS